MAPLCYEYNWKTWRAERIIPKTNPLPKDVFFIQIRSRDFVISHNLHSNNVKGRCIQEPLSPMKLKSLCVKKDSLFNKEQEAKKAVYDVLRFMGVPCHLLKVVINDIVAFGRRMVDLTPGRDVLPMVFEFATVAMEMTDENDVPNPPRAQLDMPVAKRRRV